MRTCCFITVSFAVLACGGSSSSGSSKSGADAKGSDAAAAASDAAAANDSVPAPESDTAAPDVPAPEDVVAADPTACPHIDLGGAVPATYSGTTDGLPNLAESNRLEWEDAPDDSLRFVAPADGDYTIALESTNESLGASAEQYTGTSTKQIVWTPASCPAKGAVADLDGVYDHNNPDYPLHLTSGQEILIWVSAPYWAKEKTGSYTITVDKK